MLGGPLYIYLPNARVAPRDDGQSAVQSVRRDTLGPREPASQPARRVESSAIHHKNDQK